MNYVTDEEFNAAVAKYRRTRRKNPTGGSPDGWAIQCVNLNHKGQRCVVSQIMHDLGVDSPDLDEVNNDQDVLAVLDGARTLSLTHWQANALVSAQALADGGKEWWQALKGCRV